MPNPQLKQELSGKERFASILIILQDRIMWYSYQSIKTEQVKSPSQIPPKAGGVVLQLWTMWALCQLPPTQRNPRRSQRKHRWNQPHCLATGRQNPRCRSGAVRLCALSRVFPATPIHGDTCIPAKNSSCVFSQGKTHVILEVHITSSKREQVWSPSANLKTQSPFQGKNTRAPPSPAHQGLLGFAGIFLYPSDADSWTMRPTGLSCYWVDGDCNLLCQTSETHPLLQSLP